MSFFGQPRWLPSKRGAAICALMSTRPVRAENLNPDVLVMQSANQGVRHDASDLLNQARDRRILVQ
jgi:hypothetical protein